MAKAQRREVATYHYVSRHGEAIRRKIRFDPKGFKWECYTESGWQDGYGSEMDVLYRLPEVWAAVEQGETVTVVEGEKDADRFVKDGFGSATTPPQNGKWPAGLARPLAGADVMLIWDRDDDGARRARWAMEALDEVGASWECWRAARGKDFSDHRDNELSVEHLIREDPPTVAETTTDSYAEKANVEEVLGEAGEFRDVIEGVLETFSGGEPDIAWMTVEEVLNQPPPRWLVEGWVPEVGYTVLYGAAGVGKTILVSDLADAIARGLDWHGYRVDRGSVVMLEGEGTQQLGPVYAALVRARGDLNGAAPAYFTQSTWDITSPAGLARLALEVLRRGRVRVLVVDSAGLYGTVNKDGVEDTRSFALGMRSLALGLNITVIVLQHTNAMGEARGTRHLQMFSEAVLKLEAMGSREAGLFHVDKNRYGPLKAMRMERVSLGTSMIWDCSRGSAGDEYLPEDFQREKAARREEAKAEASERRATATVMNPEYREAVWEEVPADEANACSYTVIRDAVRGVQNSMVKPILESMRADGLITSKIVGKGERYWRST
jgi:hypothetical protein